MREARVKPILFGLCASIALLLLYFGVVSLVSGWSFARDQFSDFGTYIVVLSLGFGVQVGLYIYLRTLSSMHAGKMLATTGTTSTAAMISCCTHYLVNALPFLGLSALATFVTQYQIELFWIGIVFNTIGIMYMSSKIVCFKKAHEK